MTFQKLAFLEIIIFIQLPHMKSSSLDYKNLRDLNVSCLPYDTCVGRVSYDFLDIRSCDCGPFCARHGTCCIDSPYKDVKLPTTLEECTWIESIKRSVFMVSKCDLLWDGPNRTKELCEGGLLSLEDPVSIIPVINMVSGMNYANVFCAMCNWETNFHFWYFEVIIKKFQDDGRICAGLFPRALEYTNATGKLGWGYWHEYTTNRKKFIQLELKIEIPPHARGLVTECFGDCVSECASDWNDEEMKRKCESYMAAIEVPLEDDAGSLGSTTYRNVHCALCNRVENLSKASCRKTEGKSLKLPQVLSFPHQLPSQECFSHIAAIEILDDPPACQTVVCDPGYKFHDRKCVPGV